jgi:hypothetical protein
MYAGRACSYASTSTMRSPRALILADLDHQPVLVLIALNAVSAIAVRTMATSFGPEACDIGVRGLVSA